MDENDKILQALLDGYIRAESKDSTIQKYIYLGMCVENILENAGLIKPEQEGQCQQ